MDGLAARQQRGAHPDRGQVVLGLTPGLDGKRRRILCIGAHCDDIEIGCAGTLLQLQKSSANISIDWVILTGNDLRRAEASRAMRRIVGTKHRGQLLFGDFPDARLPAVYGPLKDFFDTLRGHLRPDMVFCHAGTDAHQDHRLISELVWGAFRDHLILEYEIVKWDGDLATPNMYVPLTRGIAKKKVDTLMRVYGSQRSRDWFTEDTFLSMMRIRGIECRAASGYAEAFHLHKGVLELI